MVKNMIIEKVIVGTYASNCYIVADELTGEGMIIDPGSEPDKILQSVKNLKIVTSLIVLTHRHLDHVGASAKIKEKTGALIGAHPACAQYLPHSPDYLYPSGYEGAPAIELLLEDGHKINIGNLTFVVLHTPGHTPCGISLYGAGHVFTGDTLFNYGIGRYDLVDGDYNTLITSIKTKLITLPPETIVHPGHGPDSTIATEIRANPFLK